MCGEQSATSANFFKEEGSPPRVRGTEAKEYGIAAESRITPACAGNSDAGYGGMGLYGDHPRVCGEQGLPLWS